VGATGKCRKQKTRKVVDKPVPHGTGRRAAPFSRVHNIMVTRCLMTIQDCPFVKRGFAAGDWARIGILGKPHASN
jgi:hypothetical protein